MLCIFQYKIDCRIAIELLDTESDDQEKTVGSSHAWTDYVDRLTNPAAGPSSTAGGSGGGNSGDNNKLGAGTASADANATAKLDIKTETPEDESVS